MMKSQDMTYENMKAQILHMLKLNDEEFDPNESLIDFGLDSMQVMQLMESWAKAGVELNFVELAQDPTLNAWWSLIQKKTEAS